MGYPVHVFGTSDYNKKIHIIAIGFSTREKTEQFDFCFEAIKNGVMELFEHELEWNGLMSDAAAAIKNAFENVGPYKVNVLVSRRKSYTKKILSKCQKQDNNSSGLENSASEPKLSNI